VKEEEILSAFLEEARRLKAEREAAV